MPEPRPPKAPYARRFDRLRAHLHEWRHELGVTLFGPLAPILYRHEWLRHLPTWRLRRRPPGPWAEYDPRTPDALRTVPGAWRDERAADEAYSEVPLHEFWNLHPEGLFLLPRYGWNWQLMTLVRRLRTRSRVSEISSAERQPPAPPPAVAAPDLTERVRAEATRLGLSQVGFTAFDERYVFNGPAELDRGSVVVCLLEQDWGITQEIPSAKAERSVMRTYEELFARARDLAEFIQAQGFRAQLHGPAGALVSIAFAVDAGLGQLGLNGQLLTPYAGSRCRIATITTNATFVHGEPTDFGVNAICDACQICVKRCPPGAIPKRRQLHRGVMKAKIKPDRCLPIMAQIHGCAICMKVCPVQRYGLDAVVSHYVETGDILGRGTDELEGYKWIDGRHYPPGHKPRITRELMRPMGFVVDAKRQVPPNPDAPIDHIRDELSVG